MRLGKKKDKDKEAEIKSVDGITRLICLSKSQAPLKGKFLKNFCPRPNAGGSKQRGRRVHATIIQVSRICGNDLKFAFGQIEINSE